MSGSCGESKLRGRVVVVVRGERGAARGEREGEEEIKTVVGLVSEAGTGRCCGTGNLRAVLDGRGGRALRSRGLCGEAALRGRVVVVVRGERGEGPEERETEREVWPITNLVQRYCKTSNADCAEMGIMVRDSSTLPSPAAAQTTRRIVLAGRERVTAYAPTAIGG